PQEGGVSLVAVEQNTAGVETFYNMNLSVVKTIDVFALGLEATSGAARDASGLASATSNRFGAIAGVVFPSVWVLAGYIPQAKMKETVLGQSSTVTLSSY